MSSRREQVLLFLAAFFLDQSRLSAAYPSYFVSRDSSSCFDVPTTNYKRHGPPVSDSSTSFSITDQNNIPITSSLCPGATYYVSVSFANAMTPLLVASDGIFSSASQYDPAGCKNRFYADFGATSTSFSSSYVAPCSGSSILFQVLSAALENDYFHQSTLTVLLNPSCAANSCTGQSSPLPLPHPLHLLPFPPSALGPLVISPPPASQPPHPPSPQPPSSTSCSPSSLGYDCSVATIDGAAIIHWASPFGSFSNSNSSLGKKRRLHSASPSNACTGSSNTSAAPNTLYFAVEAATTGYLGLGFSQSTTMFHSDVILGWISGSQTVLGNWNIPSDYYYIQASTKALPWTTSQSIIQSIRASDGATVTTLCFSRLINTSTASVSSYLQPTSIKLIYAVQSSSDGGPAYGNSHTYRGALAIDLTTGSSMTLRNSVRLNAVIIHGALMVVAWILLFPLGVLFARHGKWILAGRKMRSKELWFRLHQILQISGLTFFIAGICYAFLYLDTGSLGRTGNGGIGSLSSCTAAHQVFGCILIGLCGLQIILGFIRPHPGDSFLRRAWEGTHRNLGRVAIVSGWIVSILGYYIGHSNPNYQLSASQWLVPIITFILIFIILDIILTVLSLRRVKMAVDGFASKVSPLAMSLITKTDQSLSASQFTEIEVI